MLDVVLLESIVPLQFQGPDARNFVQGQLTNDLRRLTAKNAVFGAHCTGQGRVQALVTMIEREEGLLALFDAGPFDGLFPRLRASILSSKVVIERPRLAIAAVTVSEAKSLVDRLPQAPGECSHAGSATVLRWWSAEDRLLAILPHAQVRVRPDDDVRRALAWRRGEVMAGLPHIFPETMGSFVPQTLNLDLVNGLSYDKGCYVGQEVVARARRGGVSRRMFRFSAACPAPGPGTVVIADEAEVGLVIEAVTSDSGCDLLAVVELDRVSAPLYLRSLTAAALALSPLPYVVPRERR